jgi:Family of unknown function (DUF6062)
VSRSIGDTKLLDACQQSGCPVCRRVDEESRHHVDGLLHELANDLETRSALRRSWGFCNWHGWMTLAAPGARTGVAIMYADVLRSVSGRVRRTSRSAAGKASGNWRHRVAAVFLPDGSTTEPADGGRAACLVCQSVTRGESRYLRTLCLVGVDDAVTRAYDASDGLCLRHLQLAMERGRIASSLVAHTLRKWDELAGLLDDFVKKHEYRNAIPFTEAEARACDRAVETLSGGRGVWANDLHGDAHPRRRPGTTCVRRA